MDEISGMREIFLDMDKDKSGTITVDEFASAIRKKGGVIPDAEIQKILAVCRAVWQSLQLYASCGRWLLGL